MIGLRHGINRINILRHNDGAFAHITKQRDFAFLAFGYRAITTAQQNIRLNTDGAQFLNRVLRRFGLHLSRRRNIRQQSQVNINAMTAWQVIAQLTNGLKKRQTFNIANRAANLAKDKINIISF